MTISGKKEISGDRVLNANEFRFKLEAVTVGAPMPAAAIVSDQADGAITFGQITFNKAGTYVYQLTELDGGIANKNALLMQIYADVLNREIRICQSTQAGALGSAIYGAVAAGVYETIGQAAESMSAPVTKCYYPNAENHRAYLKLYEEYALLHDYFGRGGNDVMKRLFAEA